MSQTQTPPTTLKGGIEATGLHAAELERRATLAARMHASSRDVRPEPTGVLGCIARNPFASVAAALGAGLLVGLLACGRKP